VPPAAESSGENNRQSPQSWPDLAGALGALRCEYPCTTAPVCANTSASASNVPSLATHGRSRKDRACVIGEV